jgi:hypothetical protein
MHKCMCGVCGVDRSFCVRQRTNLLGEDDAPVEEGGFGVVNKQRDSVLILVVKVRVYLRLAYLHSQLGQRSQR